MRTGVQALYWYDPQAQNTDIKHLPPLEKAQHPTLELHGPYWRGEPFDYRNGRLWRAGWRRTIAGVKRGARLRRFSFASGVAFYLQQQARGGLRNLYDIAEVLEQAWRG